MTETENKKPPPHPRTLGWYGTAALAMGGSNQSLFIIGALFIGQGEILGQGSAAVPLLIIGLLLSWAAAPGWTELILMYPNRVGGISASCSEAFRPYSPVLANLTGVCYWWGWVPTCGLTAILSASAIHHWYLPEVPINAMAIGLVLFFMTINLCGIKWVSRMAIPIATTSAAMAFISGMAPILAGEVDWRQATTFTLTTPFDGMFGKITSLMAGLYLIGFAAPAFEAAACHVGETVNPNKNVPRAMFASGAVAGMYFILLPLVWLGTIGAEPLGKDLALVLGPTFAPLFGNAGKAAAIWFMTFSMFSGTLQPLAGAARTLAQLSEDGLLPRFLAYRSPTDAPWAGTILTAAMAILFLLIGDPIWLIAAANFTYLIGIALPSVAVWLLRRDAPEAERPYRAPRGFIELGLLAAIVWGISALLGFEQFGLPTVVIGLAFAYAGSALYAWRRYDDRRRAGQPGVLYGLQLKLTGAMLLVLVLDGTGYLLAVGNLPQGHSALLTSLSDIFVAVAMLTIAVALVLPGMIGHSAMEVSNAARHLAEGTLAEFSRAMGALGRGDIDAAHAHVDIRRVRVYTRDEVGEMAESFNTLQEEIGSAAVGLDSAREGLRQARGQLTEANANLAARADKLARSNAELEQFAYVASHDLQEPLRTVASFTQLLARHASGTEDKIADEYAAYITDGVHRMQGLIEGLLAYSRVAPDSQKLESANLERVLGTATSNLNVALTEAGGTVTHEPLPTLRVNSQQITQLFQNLIGNALKFRGRKPPQVHVSAQRNGKDWTFSVRDNGIGIDPQYTDRIFQLFQRLHTRDKIPGSGIGLAICKKIVEHHGGHIWVESGNPGSNFRFTLPAA